MIKEYHLNSVFLYIQQLLTQHKNEITESQYQHSIYVVEQFYSWYCYGSLSADDLYILIGCNDDLETDSIFNYAEYSQEKCETIYYMWEIILSILMTIVCIAFQKENVKYVPQDIEIINPSKIDNFFRQIELNTAPKELLEYFNKEVCY